MKSDMKNINAPFDFGRLSHSSLHYFWGRSLNYYSEDAQTKKVNQTI